MRDSMSIPVWVIALVLASLAPFGARALASMFERRSHERSARILARTRSDG